MHLTTVLLLIGLQAGAGFVVKRLPSLAQLPQSLYDSSTKLEVIKTILTNLRRYEAAKEESRNLRRTVFTNVDWRRHRSSDRYFRELLKMPKSIVLRSLTNQSLGVAFISSLLVLYNLVAELRLFPTPLPLFTFPSLPFTLTSPSLGLLLVFRTNAAYSRWKDSRIYWASISAKSFDIIRQSVAWMTDKKDVAAVARNTVAFSKALKWHLGNRTNEKRLIDDMNGVLTNEEIDALLRARHKPQYILTQLTKIIARQNLVPNVQSHIDRAIIELSMSMENCDRIFTTPIPLVYTRLTSRFLLLWLLTFPLSLYNEFRLELKWVVPIATFLNSMFLFGIEDLGVQIEEPFSILPLANICQNILLSGQSVLQDSDVAWFQGIDGGVNLSYEAFRIAKATKSTESGDEQVVNQILEKAETELVGSAEFASVLVDSNVGQGAVSS